MEHGTEFKFAIQSNCHTCTKKRLCKSYASSDIEEMARRQEPPSISGLMREHGPHTSVIIVDYMHDLIEVWLCEDPSCMLAYHWEQTVAAIWNAEDRAKATAQLEVAQEKAKHGLRVIPSKPESPE